jgi:hypothetical protein
MIKVKQIILLGFAGAMFGSVIHCTIQGLVTNINNVATSAATVNSNVSQLVTAYNNVTISPVDFEAQLYKQTRSLVAVLEESIPVLKSLLPAAAPMALPTVPPTPMATPLPTFNPNLGAAQSRAICHTNNPIKQSSTSTDGVNIEILSTAIFDTILVNCYFDTNKPYVKYSFPVASISKLTQAVLQSGIYVKLTFLPAKNNDNYWLNHLLTGSATYSPDIVNQVNTMFVTLLDNYNNVYAGGGITYWVDSFPNNYQVLLINQGKVVAQSAQIPFSGQAEAGSFKGVWVCSTSS